MIQIILFGPVIRLLPTADSTLEAIARVRMNDEFRALSDAEGFMSKELGKVVVQKAGSKGIKGPSGSAKDALPSEPAFYLE
jgi:hypothetical protein